MAILVIGETVSKVVKGKIRYRVPVRCSCGKEWIVEKHHLKVITSCGCKRIRHGQSCNNGGRKRTKTYQTWEGLHGRCYNENCTAYHRYGGRGIKVCDRWRNSFESFLEDMGERPEGMTLDRIDNNLGYSKENCRWATLHTQSRNTRRNVWITIEGVTKCVTDWAIELGIKPDTIFTRLRRGWSDKESIFGKLKT
jgi:hypothetical protein